MWGGRSRSWGKGDSSRKVPAVSRWRLKKVLEVEGICKEVGMRGAAESSWWQGGSR